MQFFLPLIACLIDLSGRSPQVVFVDGQAHVAYIYIYIGRISREIIGRIYIGRIYIGRTAVPGVRILMFSLVTGLWP